MARIRTAESTVEDIEGCPGLALYQNQNGSKAYWYYQIILPKEIGQTQDAQSGHFVSAKGRKLRRIRASTKTLVKSIAIGRAIDKWGEANAKLRNKQPLKDYRFSFVLRKWLEDCEKQVSRGELSEFDFERIKDYSRRYFSGFFVRDESQLDKNIAEIGNHGIQEYIRWRKDQGLGKRGYTNRNEIAPSENTTVKENKFLHLCFLFARQKNWIPDIPDIPRRSRKPNPRDWFEAQEQRVLNAYLEEWAWHATYEGTKAKAPQSENKRFHRRVASCAFQILLASGIRPGKELTTLQWKHIFPEPDKNLIRIKVQEGKTGERTVLISEDYQYLFNRLAETTEHTKPNDFLFCHPNGKQKTKLATIWRQVLMDSDLFNKGKSNAIYKLRHTCITNMTRPPLKRPIAFIAQNCGTSIEMIEKHYLKKGGFEELFKKPETMRPQLEAPKL